MSDDLARMDATGQAEIVRTGKASAAELVEAAIARIEAVNPRLNAGFVFVGKTNTPELGILPTCEPEAHGPTRNPWNTQHSTGGSSGGSAAAVASGMVPVGHANDGGGSIRIPAGECGLVGLKPTRGRTSLGPEYGAVHGPMPGDPFAAPTPARPFLEEVGADPGRLRVGPVRDGPLVHGATVAVRS